MRRAVEPKRASSERGSGDKRRTAEVNTNALKNVTDWGHLQPLA